MKTRCPHCQKEYAEMWNVQKCPYCGKANTQKTTFIGSALDSSFSSRSFDFDYILQVSGIVLGLVSISVVIGFIFVRQNGPSHFFNTLFIIVGILSALYIGVLYIRGKISVSAMMGLILLVGFIAALLFPNKKSPIKRDIYGSATEKMNKGLPITREEAQRVHDVLHYKENRQIEEIEQKHGVR